MTELNQTLATILTSPETLSRHPDKIKVLAALDAILAAGHGDDESNRNFRRAIINHREFWNPLIVAEGGILIAEGINQADDDHFLEEDDWRSGRLEATFQDLTSYAAKKRILISLNQATEPELLAIIQQGITDRNVFRGLLFNGDGTSRFGVPAVHLKNWNPLNDSVIDPPACQEILSHAKKQLLLRKIEECSDIRLLNSLAQHSLQPGDIRELFNGSTDNVHTLAGEMLPEMRDNNLLHAAALRVFRLYIKNLDDDDDEKFKLLNEMDPAKFLEEVQSGQPFNWSGLEDTLDEDDFDTLKKMLGARFICLNALNIPSKKITDIEAVASANTLHEAKIQLRKFNRLLIEREDNYLDKAVKEGTLPVIRQTFATRALQIKIAQCKDAATLDALICLTDVNGLKELLERNVGLGYNDKPEFQAAFQDTKVLYSIITSAHIRKNLSLSTDPDPALLKELIALKKHPEFTNRYIDALTTDATDEAIKIAIRTHLRATPVDIKRARSAALKTYATLKIPDAAISLLNGLVNATTGREVATRTRILFDLTEGEDGPADDLILDNLDNDLVKAIRTKAAIEKVIYDAKVNHRADYSQTTGGDNAHAALLAKINHFNFNPADDLNLHDLLNAENFPENEKIRIQAGLVQDLIRNYPADRIAQPPAPNQLMELALAKETDSARIKTLLVEKFQVTEVAWVNEETIKQVQTEACKRVIGLGSRHPVQFGKEAHPQLFKLIENLPLEKQRALLDKPEALTALTSAYDKNEVEQILGNKHLVDPAIIQSVFKENERLLPLGNIANSEIAKIVAQFDPPISLSEEKVSEINLRLIDAPIVLDNNPDATQHHFTNYEAAIQDIVQIIDPQPNTDALYTAFGLDSTGKLINATDGKMQLVRDQQAYNRQLISVYHTTTNPVNATIILGLLPLSKTGNAAFPSDRIIKSEESPVHEGIVTDILNCKSLTEFRNLITPPGRDYDKYFKPPLHLQLTPKAYERLRQQARHAGFTDPLYYKKMLKKQAGDLNEMKAQFSNIQLDEENLEKLNRLAKMKPVYWFNPAFQASAKQNAAVFGGKFQALSKICDSYVTNLSNQLSAIKKQLETLPTRSEISESVGEQTYGFFRMYKAINERAKELKYLERMVDDELHEYLPLQKVFKGRGETANSVHPILREGLLATLDKAKEGKSDLRINQFVKFSFDFKNTKEERVRRLGANWQGEPNENPADAVSLESTGSYEGFETVDALKEGDAREHTIEYPNERGILQKYIYIEERPIKNLVGEAESGRISYEPSIKLTATRFPPADDPEGRVFVAMAIASQLVANLKALPTEKKQIVLKGTNPEMVRFVWNALMIIGDSDENFKFGKDQIKVATVQFDPAEEYSFGGLRWDSNCKKTFMDDHRINSMLSAIKDVNQRKFSPEEKKERRQHIKDTVELTQFYKRQMPAIEAENTKQEETDITLGSTGPTI